MLAADHSVEAKVCFPGDTIELNASVKNKLGVGIVQQDESVIASRWGKLRQTGNKLWVDNYQKRVCFLFKCF
jgi:hypothetical protein